MIDLEFNSDRPKFILVSTDQVNYLNIGLMGISLAAAFILPFEVFLFSYAFLGPLHYLTEISWLHDRKYFAPKRWDYVPLVVLSVVLLIGSGEKVLGEGVQAAVERLGLGPFSEWVHSYFSDITFIAFGVALLLVLTKNTGVRIGGGLVLCLVAYLMHNPKLPELSRGASMVEIDKYLKAYERRSGNPYWAIFAVYIPTLIHVYVFTGAFILFGALKRSSRTGYLSFAVFVCCALAALFLFTDMSFYTASTWAQESYGGIFESVNKQMMFHFGGFDGRASLTADVFANPVSILFARFIAFAYTYHYLNWFSKTSVIRWHKVPKLRFLAVILIWLASIGLYFYDYKLGFSWLFLLSFAHVLLEFPLNHQSFIGIVEEVGKRLQGGKAGAKVSS